MSEFTQAELDRASQLYDIMRASERGKAHQRGFALKGFNIGQKNDPPGNPSGPYSHGNGGLFSTPGQERPVFSTMVMPIQSLANRLPVMPQGSASPDDPSFGGLDSPLFTTVTGVTGGASETWENQPNEICDDAPEGGLLKACTLTAPYGRVYQGVKELSINEVGRLMHRAEPTDLMLMNGLMDGGTPFQTPMGVPTGGSTILHQEFAKRIFEAGASFQRLMAGLTWNGNPTNNKAGGGAKQFMGMNLFIAAGNKLDAINGTPCPSMDSDIKDFGFDLITGGVGSRDIVQYVDMIFHYLSKLARDTGLDPVTWGIAMRPEMFDELVKVWPVRYYQEFLTQIAQFTGGVFNLEAMQTADFRDNMRNGEYLVIRGRQIPVFLDDSITELNSTTAAIPAGDYASDMYFVPLTVLGGIPVTWWEYFREDNLQAMDLERITGGQTYTTDGGMFRWFVNHKNGCIRVQWKTEPRIIMRTPFLAGRIQNIRYRPLQHTRQAFPDEPYFVNGGNVNRGINSYYTEYATETPVPIPG